MYVERMLDYVFGFEIEIKLQCYSSIPKQMLKVNRNMEIFQ